MKKSNNQTEIARLKRELSDANKQIKKLSKDSEKYQVKSKEKIAKLQKELKKKRRSESNIDKRTRTITFEPIENHTYSEFIVRLSTMLYTRVKCGLRQVVKILDVLNDIFEGLLGTIPCYNSVENWVKKCGLQVYETSSKTLHGTEYAEIVDESMFIGSEKLLVTLGIPAEHQGRPLNCADASILGIAVAKSWSGEGVKDELRKASAKVGHDPNYIVSDNASIMEKGVRCAEFNHHRDISHSLGMFLEREYKIETDFVEYLKLMSESKRKHNMKKTAYLLPPTQRTISRFLNLSGWVKWSSKMLEVYHSLNPDEREVFSYIPANASLIDELTQVILCISRIEYICKHKGLSQETIGECRKEVQKHLFLGNSRMVNLGDSISQFLKKEAMLLGEDITARNNSSDVIESLFGVYKSRKSPNKLNGITPFILFVPIYTQLHDNLKSKKFDFKKALEEIRMKHIDEWAKENLTPNLVQLRIKRLGKTA